MKTIFATVHIFAVLFLLLVCTTPVYAESCTTATCHPEFSEITEPHFPGWEEECTSCHERQSEVHPVVAGKTFLLIAEGPELCGMCHDLSFNKKHVHPPVADGSCSSCHQPHGYTAETSIKGDGLRNLCLMCHDGFEPEEAHVHGPVAVGACTVCHDPHQSDEPFRLIKPMISGFSLNYGRFMKITRK